MILRAIQFARDEHEGQVRKFTGEPYFNHVRRVAEIVSQFTDSEDMVITAYLHDTVEDCGVQIEEIEFEFNLVVGALVQELTNVYTKQAYPEMNRKERKAREHKRLAKISKLGKLIKLADRIDNIRDFKAHDPDFKQYGLDHYYFRESLELLKVLRGTNPIIESILEIELV